MDKDLQRRVIFGGIALAIFIPILMMGRASSANWYGTFSYARCS